MAMFTILLVAGNTMAQAIRERTSELAVLKTLGFGEGRILRMVLLESALIARRRRRAGAGDLVRRSSRWRAIRRTACCRRSTSRRPRCSPASGWSRRWASAPASCPRGRPAGCASSTR